MSKNFVVYHLHSDLSNGVTNIDSVTKYKEYVEYAKSLGMTALAFAEHGNIFEWVHKKEAIEAAGMKYIHAAEVYLTTDKDAENKHRDNYHCVLIAKNYDGVKELNRLISSSFNRDDYHYYYAPRISFDELYTTSDNIIITTACLGGVLNKADNSLKTEFLKFLVKNKHRCYLEVQHHNCVDQANYNKVLYAIHQKTGIPLIAGTDTHCLNDTHIGGRSILQKAKNVFFSDEESWDLTFKTYEELVEAYRKQNALPEDVYLNAIENTNVMAESIEPFKLDYSKKYPKLYNDSEKALKEKIVNGIKNRGIDKYDNFNEYKKKIQYELETYKYNGAMDFLLLEEDYKSALKKQGVSYGYSRGSVSGSIIAYLLGITEVDSIKYNLNFERFMNKERVSLADVDTDWSKKDRYKVREYLFNKEGLYCCDIITFNTIALKGAIKDVGRALGMSVDETQALSDAVYQDENKKDCIDDFYIKKYPELFKYVDIVKGTIVSIGNHPAGLVVSPFPIDEWFGLCTTKTNENMISQINMKELDGLQFVKLDVLGLDCVGLINETCDLAGIPRITPDNISFDDKKVWNEIRDDCTMIFQFESSYAGDYIKQLFSDETIAKIKEQNENFSYIDLMSMANGAIRPAGASYRDELSTGKYHDNGHEALNKFLAPTLGYLVYQEQIIEFLHSFCGYTMGEADIVRRGFAKKTGTDKFIPKIKDGFIKTMQEKYNVDEEESNQLIESFIQVIIDASSYLFSLNHATPYSFLGYVVGWLRCYYKLETITTALNIYEGDSDKCLEILQYAKKHGIELKPIRFGKSGSSYTIDKENNAIYKGISSIKYCNIQIANELLELSHNKYETFTDLLKDIKEKTSLNSRQLNILTGLDFFSEFGNNKYLLNVIEVYDKFASAKIIAKKKMEELGVTEFLMTKYAGKETKSQYRDIDNQGLIKELCSRLPNESMGVVEQIKFEMEFLEYTTYVNPDFADYYYVVLNFKTFSDPTKPHFTLRSIKTGEEIKTRIRQSKLYRENPFGEFAILDIKGFTYVHKKKNIGGDWVETEELEPLVTEFEVIKNG
jgi:DNA polymerase-3 subunit alpha